MRSRTIATRRSFFWKAGAALSVPLTAVAARPTRPQPDDVEGLKARLAALEGTSAIRELHRTYVQHLNERAYEALIALFTDDSEVLLGGSRFAGRERGVRTLYMEHFGRRILNFAPEPVHVSLQDRAHEQDFIEIASEGQSATARFSCVVQAEATIVSDLPILEMARQQGQGVRRWTEDGVFENAYVKSGKTWKIRRLGYRAA